MFSSDFICLGWVLSWTDIPSDVAAMGRTFSSCPVSVDDNTNPFQSRPEDLTVDKWYVACSGCNRGSEAGSWKPKGEPRQVTVMGLPLVCWVTIRVFREVDYQETDWIMTQYEITTDKETVSICKIRKDSANQVGDPFPFNHCRHQADNCPFLDAGVQYASSIFSGGNFLELDDLV